MKKTIQIITFVLFALLLNIQTVGANIATVQPTPARMSVRMLQAAQQVEIQIEDLDHANTSGRILILNIIGKVVASRNIDLQTGDNAFSFDVSDLSQGTYIVQVQSGNWFLEARKFIKSNP